MCVWETMHVVDNCVAFDFLVPECACGRISWASVFMVDEDQEVFCFHQN